MRPRSDICVCALLILATCAFTLGQIHRIEPVYHDAERNAIWDAWFDTDPHRIVHRVAVDRYHGQYDGSYRHPLFAPMVFLPTQALVGIGLSATNAVKILVTLSSGLWVALFFVLLRLAGRRMLEAAIFTMLAVGSAAGMFMFAVPETFLLGSTTMLIGLGYALLPKRKRCFWGTVAVSALTASVTVSNWMVGILITLRQLSFRRATLATVLAGIALLILNRVTFFFFPATELPFFGADLPASQTGLGVAGGVWPKLYSIFVTTIVAPEPQVFEQNISTTTLILATQYSHVNTLLGAIAVASWLALLALGGWGLVRSSKTAPLRWVLPGVMAGQVLMHLVVGKETFLYSLHFLPLLVLGASFAMETPWRKVARRVVGAATGFWLGQQLAEVRTGGGCTGGDRGSRASGLHPS